MKHIEFIGDGFLEFIERSGHEEDTFSNMVEHWAEYGNAVELTGGDFALWMQSIIYLRESPKVAQQLQRNDLKFSFEEGVPDCLNPLIWNYYVSQQGRTGDRGAERSQDGS